MGSVYSSPGLVDLSCENRFLVTTQDLRIRIITCIFCQLFEHILCSHIHKHLEHHGILTTSNIQGFGIRLQVSSIL